MPSSAIWRAPDADQPAPAPQFPPARGHRARVRRRGSPESSVPTARGRPPCSRRSPGRCTACPPPAAAGRRIRRRGAPPARPRSRWRVEFTLGAHHYRIVRSLNSAELYQDGDPAPIANSLGAVTERVTRLLGMTREEFFNTYFTGQKELAVMAAMSAPERAQFLSRVLGYERLRAAQERLKEKRSALRARLDALRSGLAGSGRAGAEEEARARERLAAARGGRSGDGGGRGPGWSAGSPSCARGGSGSDSSARRRWLSRPSSSVADHEGHVRRRAAPSGLERQVAEAEAAGARLDGGRRAARAPARAARTRRGAGAPGGGASPAGRGSRRSSTTCGTHLASVEERQSAAAAGAGSSRPPSLRAQDAARAALTACALDAEERQNRVGSGRAGRQDQATRARSISIRS